MVGQHRAIRLVGHPILVQLDSFVIEAQGAVSHTQHAAHRAVARRGDQAKRKLLDGIDHVAAEQIDVGQVLARIREGRCEEGNGATKGVTVKKGVRSCLLP